MKRTLAILALSGLLTFSLTGCGENDKRNDNAYTDGNDSATAQTYLYRGTRSGTATGKNSTVSRNTNASANARLRGSSKSVTGTVANPDTNTGGMLGTDEEYDDRAAEVRYQLMLDNARVRDTDGFLFDGENGHHAT